MTNEERHAHVKAAIDQANPKTFDWTALIQMIMNLLQNLHLQNKP